VKGVIFMEYIIGAVLLLIVATGYLITIKKEK